MFLWLVGLCGGSARQTPISSLNGAVLKPYNLFVLFKDSFSTTDIQYFLQQIDFFFTNNFKEKIKIKWSPNIKFTKQEKSSV